MRLRNCGGSEKAAHHTSSVRNMAVVGVDRRRSFAVRPSAPYCALIFSANGHYMGTRGIKAFGLVTLLMAGVPAVFAVSAPPLTEVKVIKVQSPACGLEDIADGQAQTQCNHGGPSIKVYVLEIGYGRNQPQAALDGFEVNGSRSPVCAFNTGNLTECTPGSKTVGSLYTFDLAGKQEGTFTFSNTSINAPRNTMSTQLYIK
jgi:hypothetical protein